MKKKLTKAQVDQLTAILLPLKNQGVALREISRELGFRSVNRFTPEEDEIIRQEFSKTNPADMISINELARRMGRPLVSVHHRKLILGVKRIVAKWWIDPRARRSYIKSSYSEADDNFIRMSVANGMPDIEIAEALKRNQQSINHRVRILGLIRPKMNQEHRAKEILLMKTKIKNGMPRNQAMAECYKAHVALVDIGRVFKISRQRVQQICDAEDRRQNS